MPLGVDGLALLTFQRGKVAGGCFLFILLHGTIVELHQDDGNDEDEGHERIQVIGNGADEKLDAAHAGVESFCGRGDGSRPGGDRRNHAHGSRSGVNQIGKLRSGNLMTVRDRAHDGADGQAVKIVVDENENAEDERCKLRACVRFDVGFRPAAESSRAARSVDQRDDDAEQDEKQENAGVICDGSDQTVVDDGVERGDGGEVRGEQRADDDADEQRAVCLLADQRQNDGNDGRQQRPCRLGKGFAVGALDCRSDDQYEHRRNDDDAHKRMRGVLLHGFVSFTKQKLRHDSIMTQQNNPCKDDMTALRFRDSPQDILLRPRPAPAGTASPIFGAQPFCVPGSRRICGRDSCCAQPLSQLPPIIQSRRILSSLNGNFLQKYAQYAETARAGAVRVKRACGRIRWAEEEVAMFVYDFSFRSLTAAQDGRSVLQNAGVFSQLARAPKQIAEQGCGYVLEVDGPDGADALTLFLSSGVRFRRVFRQFDNGFVEEAGHDLF